MKDPAKHKALINRINAMWHFMIIAFKKYSIILEVELEMLKAIFLLLGRYFQILLR